MNAFAAGVLLSPLEHPATQGGPSVLEDTDDARPTRSEVGGSTGDDPAASGATIPRSVRLSYDPHVNGPAVGIEPTSRQACIPPVLQNR